MPDFLLEIGCEEIPARMLDAACKELAQRLLGAMVKESLLQQSTQPAYHSDMPAVIFSSFATPRRLALVLPGVLASQPDVTEQITGPSTKVAFKDGHPTPAAEAFAKKAGVEVSKLEKITNPKGEYLAATITKKGRPAAEVLAEALPKEIAAVYWAKNMYWRAGKPERFVRPIRWIVAMLDGQVVPLEFGGVKAGNQSRGHRILGPATLSIASPTQYVESLRNAHVMASPAEREQRIRKALDAAARTVSGIRWREDAALLSTVVNLTEWPSAILGNFDQQYLALPEEVLVTVMRDHQKYFAVEDASGKLAPHFLAVLNTDGDPDGLIAHGNERVLRARFNDARFFWDTDQKTPLRDRVNLLKAVTFQKDLGSYFDKAERIVNLGERLCPLLQRAGLKVDASAVQQAAWFAKTDLTAELVKEFTELQGIIGGLYAKTQSLPQSVADAIYDQYKPASMEDSVPRTLEGAVLSIADKADSIAGMFALGLVPSGSKDPFALRRQANGIVKILAEHKLSVRLGILIADSLEGYEDSEARKNFKFPSQIKEIGERLEAKWKPVAPNVRQDLASIRFLISQFFRERLEFYLRDVLHFRYDVVSAVVQGAYDRGDDEVPDLIERSKAVAEICTSTEFESLFIAFKRVKNIIRQAQEKGFAIAELQPEEKFDSEAEVAIWKEFRRLASSFLPLRKQRRYLDAFRELAKVREPVDRFFDSVMVMVDDSDVRAKRLGLLNYLLATFNTIADLSELAPESK